ncbi:MAG TPA: MarP family serine protease [Candidatus Saccharimonadales bacterium]|nr:MarP family serine protease [Candidatus Saccharimonadales bacterium]
MIIDLIIIAFVASALYRGHQIGFVRQFFSTVGFFGGLFIGAWLQHYTVNMAHTTAGRSLVTALTTFGCAIILLSIGELVGVRLKGKVMLKRINSVDDWLGSLIAVASLLVSVWLLASIALGLPLGGLQSQIKGSRIISGLNKALPDAPGVIAELGRLVDPNGFPQVFIGNEPTPASNINLPSLGSLQTAVKADENSVVKVVGQGCGGIVEGSGFVISKNLVATNAHVVAGIQHPYIQDGAGSQQGTVIGFDPDLDFAIVRAGNLAGKPLSLDDNVVASGTPAAVMGYPGGGALKANPAAVLAAFDAIGRNIYNQGSVERNVYELHVSVIPGNSGGPLIAKDGRVIGVIFAESTSYKNVGYALSMPQVIHEIHQVKANASAVSAGSCAE